MTRLIPIAVAVVIALISAIAVVSVTAAGDSNAWDPRDYCGVPPAPEPANPIPTLPAEAKPLNLTMTDYYIFTRHGDRSTLTKNCWANKAEFKNRKWVECPNNTLGFHSGLNSRSSYAPTYAMPIHPLPDKQILNGNCHLGQLTQRGLMMSLNNGWRVGKYLADIFTARGMTWTPQSLKLRSTDVHRTRETAEGFITGLLDTMPGDAATLTKQLPPLFFVDEKVDALKLNTNVCNTGPYIDEVYKTEEWVQYEKDTWKPLLAEVRTALDQPDATLADVFDCIKPFQCHSLPYPEEIKPLADRVEAAMTEYWRAAYYHQPQRSAQLFSGYQLTELSSLFAASGIKSITEKPTVSLFSGHDFGPISNLATALTFPDFMWPPYSAMINIEFYKTASKASQYSSFVRFMYVGEVVVPEFCKDQMVAKELCPTDIFLNFIASILPTADQCPGIPRKTFTKKPFSTLMEDKSSARPNAALQSAVDTLYDTLDGLRDDLIVVQAKSAEQPEPEKSHYERWSQRS